MVDSNEAGEVGRSDASDETDAKASVAGVFAEPEMLETPERVLDALNPDNKLWEGGRISSWVFRGQAGDWPLMPSAWRNRTHGDADWKYTLELAEQYATNWLDTRLGGDPHNQPGFMEKLQDVPPELHRGRALALLTQIHFERLLERRFVELADELGIDVELGASPYIRPEDYPFFERKLISPQPGQAAAFAQHHGIPTKLLDWTRNAYTALYWTVEKHLRCPEPKGTCVIWALNVRALNQLSSDYQLYRRRHEEPGVLHFNARRAGHSYLHAQDGLFTWVHGWEGHYLETGELPTLQWAVKQLYDREKGRLKGQPQQLLRQFLVPAKLAKDLLKSLQRRRVTLYQLMPTLDNVVKGIRAESWIPPEDPGYIAATEA